MADISRTLILRENLNHKSKGLFVHYFDKFTSDLVDARITGRSMIALDVTKGLIIRIRNPLPEYEDTQLENYVLYKFKKKIRTSNDILELIAASLDY